MENCTTESLSDLNTICGSNSLADAPSNIPARYDPCSNRGDQASCSGNFVALSQSTNISSLNIGDQKTFSIGLTGAVQVPGGATPADIMFVMDRSGSMDQNTTGGPSKMDVAISAFDNIIAYLRNYENNQTTDWWLFNYYFQAGFASFNHNRMIESFLQDVSSSNAYHYNINPCGCTGIANGTLYAIVRNFLPNVGGELYGYPTNLSCQNGSVKKVIIMASDGEENRLPYLDDIRSQIPNDITFYTIGIGATGEWADKLKEVAYNWGTGNGSYYDSPNVNNLYDVYKRIADLYTSSDPASKATVSITMADNFEYVSSSLQPSSISGKTIEWEIPVIKLGDLDSINVTVKAVGGSGSTNATTTDSEVKIYNKCGMKELPISPVSANILPPAPPPQPSPAEAAAGYTCSSPDQTIMKLSSATNAIGSLWSSTFNIQNKAYFFTYGGGTYGSSGVDCSLGTPPAGFIFKSRYCVLLNTTTGGCYADVCMWEKNTANKYEYKTTSSYTYPYVGANCSISNNPGAGYSLVSGGCFWSSSAGGCYSDSCLWERSTNSDFEYNITHEDTSASANVSVNCSETASLGGYDLKNRFCLRYSGSDNNCISDICLWERSNDYDICYDNIFGSPYTGQKPHDCTGTTNKVLYLDSLGKAYSAPPSGYSTACYGTLFCTNRTGSCNANERMIVSMSAPMNANLSSLSDFSTKICCAPNYIDTIPPSINLDYNGSNMNHVVGTNSPVTFTATATDDSGVGEIDLYVGYSLVKTCYGPTCSWTYTSGYPAGTLVSFSATAKDNSSNTKSTAMSFTTCSLSSVSIGPEASCDNSLGCQQGNKINVNALYSGDTCPSTAYVQVDASGGGCTIQRQGGLILGMDTTCSSGSPCIGQWTIPLVPDACKGKTVYATAATLRDSLNPATWKEFGFASDSSVTGSFKFSVGVPDLVSVAVSPAFAKYGDPLTITGTLYNNSNNALSLDCGRFSDTEGDGYLDDGPVCTGNSVPAGANQLTCQTNSIWQTNSSETIYCRVKSSQGYTGSERSGSFYSDNRPPQFLWLSPGERGAFNNTKIITVEVNVYDPPLDDGNLGSGISNGISCNLKVDGVPASGVIYYSSGSAQNGTCRGNLGTLAEGTHSLSVSLSDMIGNGNSSTTRNILIDNTPPKAWIYTQPGWSFGLPKWKNASYGVVTFPVNWGGTDNNDPTGAGLTFKVQYNVSGLGETNPVWADFANSIQNSSAVFGPSSPIDATHSEGKNISFRITATDQAGNSQTYDGWGTVIDLTPPACTLGQPFVIATGNSFTKGGFWFTNDRYNVSWLSADATSGIASYEVNVKNGVSGSWYNVNSVGYCNNTGLPSSSTSIGCGIGMNNDVYNFSCRATDAAGNVGPWSDNITMKVDNQAPISSFSPLHEWMGHNQPEWLGNEYFNLSWIGNNCNGQDDCGGTGIKCFYVRWSNSTTRNAYPDDPEKQWVNLTSNYNPSDPACLNPANKSYRFGLYSMDTTLKDGETYNFSIMSVDNIGNAESFTNWSGVPDYNTRNKNTTLDRYDPMLFWWLKDSSGNEIQPGYIDSSAATYVNITSNASDNLSGVYSNIINIVMTQSSLSAFLNTSSSQSDCVGGSWSADPYGGNSTCTSKTDYTEGTVITYTIVATDRANNTNTTTGFITTHPLANFLVHLAVLSLGATADLPVQVRNMEKTNQTITLTLSGEFSPAAFLPADQLTMIDDCQDPGKCASMTLAGGEQRIIYVRVASNGVTDAPQTLELDAVSDSVPSVTDSDKASIIIGYPPDFPVMDAWWAILLMMASAAVLFYRTEV